jgi:hypothetical protein
MDDITVKADKAPSDMRVIGRFKPILKFHWNATVVIKSLGIKQDIPGEVKLSVAEARFIRTGLKTIHRIIPVYITEDSIRIIRREKNKESRGSNKETKI